MELTEELLEEMGVVLKQSRVPDKVNFDRRTVFFTRHSYLAGRSHSHSKLIIRAFRRRATEAALDEMCAVFRLQSPRP